MKQALKCLWVAGAWCGLAWFQSAYAVDYVTVPAGAFESTLARDGDPGPIRMRAFAMRRHLVTQGEFAQFLQTHPEWQPDRVPRVLADPGYLKGNDRAAAKSPVVQVSWFAAQAYCETEQARLPSWLEWEYVAAADATRRDARADPAWLARILGWYARSANAPLPEVGVDLNVYGLSDMHGLVWEWVDDFNAMLVDADSRSGDDPDKQKFCGAGAINYRDRLNYAVLMRIALLSSLSADASTASLGFRCVKELP